MQQCPSFSHSPFLLPSPWLVPADHGTKDWSLYKRAAHSMAGRDRPESNQNSCKDGTQVHHGGPHGHVVCTGERSRKVVVTVVLRLRILENTLYRVMVTLALPLASAEMG